MSKGTVGVEVQIEELVDAIDLLVNCAVIQVAQHLEHLLAQLEDLVEEDEGDQE